ncbi:MAG: flippase-like domain-containing protein [candidate division Zixibacteria bacterium]|nr:flippase-like domain-containing protein [candidate division Zixibacteria bacterium]
MLKISPVKKMLSILIVLIIFFILGRILYLNIETLLRYEWHFKYYLLFPSLLFLGLNYLIAAYVWTFILKMLGCTINLTQSFRITYLSAVGKYIPGKIWTYVSQIYLADKVGLAKRLTLVSMVSMFVAYNGIAILFFISTLLLWENIPTDLVIILIPLFSLLLLFALHPRVLSKAVNFFLRFFKKEKLEFKINYKNILFLLGLLILDRVIFSTFAYLFINSFLTLNFIGVVKFSGIFSVAVFLGVITFIAPGGLGVREGVQSYLLSFFIPVSMAILISLVMRVWMTLGELICFLVALKIKKPKLT